MRSVSAATRMPRCKLVMPAMASSNVIHWRGSEPSCPPSINARLHGEIIRISGRDNRVVSEEGRGAAEEPVRVVPQSIEI